MAPWEWLFGPALDKDASASKEHQNDSNTLPAPLSVSEHECPLTRATHPPPVAYMGRMDNKALDVHFSAVHHATMGMVVDIKINTSKLCLTRTGSPSSNLCYIAFDVEEVSEVKALPFVRGHITLFYSALFATYEHLFAARIEAHALLGERVLPLHLRPWGRGLNFAVLPESELHVLLRMVRFAMSAYLDPRSTDVPEHELSMPPEADFHITWSGVQ